MSILSHMLWSRFWSLWSLDTEAFILDVKVADIEADLRYGREG